MFQSARIKLTAWYLIIIMLISASFSVAIYKLLTVELDRVEKMQRQRQQLIFPFEFQQRFPRAIDQEVIEDAKNHIIIRLFLTNLGIFVLSGFAGYFLAGKTLNPIKEMMDEQNRFVTNASHELRTPLTSLKSEIEVNLRDKKLAASVRKILESNLEEVNNLQYLSDNLIKLTQYQTLNNYANFSKIVLIEIVNDAIKKVAGSAKAKQIKIEFKVNGYTLMGERQSLTELLVILLDNAIKYSSKNTEIKISAKKVDRLIKIQIKDQGMGIPQEDIPHLFDRFYRGDKSRTKEGASGYGLGLAIAKQIVDKHQGSINVESKVGEGTTFLVQLPL